MKDHLPKLELVIGDSKMRERKHIEIINHLDNENQKWFAIRTKYKAEKQVVHHLQKKKVDAYIPLVNQTMMFGKNLKPKKKIV